MRSHIICSESQADLEIFVTKYLLFVAEYGVRELGVKGANESQSRVGGRNKAHTERIVGVNEPCPSSSAMLWKKLGLEA
jgi:hypothetical protein